MQIIWGDPVTQFLTAWVLLSAAIYCVWRITYKNRDKQLAACDKQIETLERDLKWLGVVSALYATLKRSNGTTQSLVTRVIKEYLESGYVTEADKKSLIKMHNEWIEATARIKAAREKNED